MKTILGTDLLKSTRGVLYLCHFNGTTIIVITEILFTSSFMALEAYANIPNPESQLVTGKTYEEVCEELEILHANMKNRTWLNALKECL